MSIVDHLETHLGPIAEGWSASREPGSPRVVRFDDVPVEHVCTYTTLGLSRHLLRMKDGRDVRQELLVAVARGHAPDDVARFVQAAAHGLLADHRALLRGELIGDGTPIVSGSSCTCAYAAIPTLFDESLHVYESSTPATVVVWLIPMTSSESMYVRKSGWDAFESLLEERQPDLFDLCRPAIA